MTAAWLAQSTRKPCSEARLFTSATISLRWAGGTRTCSPFGELRSKVQLVVLVLPEPGAAVIAQVVLHGDPRRAVHRVLEVDAPTRFCWRDHGPTTAFVYGQRCRDLATLPGGGTRLRVELMLDGPMLQVAVRRFGQTLREGLAAETRALRLRAEAKASEAAP